MGEKTIPLRGGWAVLNFLAMGGQILICEAVEIPNSFTIRNDYETTRKWLSFGGQAWCFNSVARMIWDSTHDDTRAMRGNTYVR